LGEGEEVYQLISPPIRGICDDVGNAGDDNGRDGGREEEAGDHGSGGEVRDGAEKRLGLVVDRDSPRYMGTQFVDIVHGARGASTVADEGGGAAEHEPISPPPSPRGLPLLSLVLGMGGSPPPPQVDGRKSISQKTTTLTPSQKENTLVGGGCRGGSGDRRARLTGRSHPLYRGRNNNCLCFWFWIGALVVQTRQCCEGVAGERRRAILVASCLVLCRGHHLRRKGWVDSLFFI
jgi:hypothetical protein